MITPAELVEASLLNHGHWGTSTYCGIHTEDLPVEAVRKALITCPRCRDFLATRVNQAPGLAWAKAELDLK